MERVKRAIREKIEFIQSKKDELGEKGFRRVLERDLNLPKRALDEEPMKGAIGKLLMRVIETGTVEDDEEEEDDDDDDDDDDDTDEGCRLPVLRSILICQWIIACCRT